MAVPYTITNVTDVPAGDESSLIQGDSGRTLARPSNVKIFANRESGDITYTVTIGGNRILLSGGAAINATSEDLPSTRDDLLIDTFGAGGQEIVILANNANVAAQEARVILWITEVDDQALLQAMKMLGRVA